MSTQSLANAFLGYGADLRTKNIVLEIVFSILPILYQSPYKILDPDDELIIDLMFQYVKQILIGRDQYKDVVLPLLEEQFPDLPMSDLTPTQLNLLAGVALKRLVAQALKDAAKSFYKASPPPPDDSVVIPKTRKNFLKKVIKDKIRLRDDRALSFMRGLFPDQWAVPIPAIRNSPQYLELFEGTTTDAGIAIEPYISITFKPKADMILCTEDLQGEFTESELNKMLTAANKAYQSLITAHSKVGKTVSVKEWTGSVLNNPSITALGGQKVYFSRENGLENFTDWFLDGIASVVGVGNQGEAASKIFSALAESVSVGLRASVENPLAWHDKAEASSVEGQLNYKTLVYYVKAKQPAMQLGKQVPPAVLTISVAEVEQKYDPADYFPLNSAFAESKVNKAAAKFSGSDWNLDRLFDLGGIGSDNPPVDIAESLFVSLMQSDDFDSLTKSLLIPATVFNAVQFIPNAEIGSVMREILRSRGCFSGLDEVLDAYISSSKNYLFGDFPFLTDCSLEGVI